MWNCKRASAPNWRNWPQIFCNRPLDCGGLSAVLHADIVRPMPDANGTTALVREIPSLAGAQQQPATYRRERKIVFLMCLLAAIHVFVFSAAFPFFNNVDEPIHFDLVMKYSHGYVPRKLETISADSAAYLALFNSCAYFGTPDKFPGNQMPSPLWTEPTEKMRQDFAITSAAWQLQKNYEVSQPPLYYALAGIWWHAGKWLGFHDGRLLFWLRFLNILPMIGLIWLAWFAAQLVFPENFFLRLGPPALIVFMPQTAFYSIGNDILSPLCFGLTFVFLVQWLSSETPSVRMGAATGLAFAATWLTKTTNLPLLIVVTASVLLKTWFSFAKVKWRSALPLLAFFCCAVPSIAVWMLWCKSNYGDLTGSNLKANYFGWTMKSFPEWRHHPIFSPAGVWTYLSGQLSTFWQGEFFWHDHPMAWPKSNFIFTALSLALLIPALPASFRAIPPAQRNALWLSMACFMAALGFFGMMSTVYDFHACPNPSREHPYFQAGRMILGMLIPFLLFFVYGLDRALNKFGNTVKFVTLGTMILGMLALEIATDWPAFSNPFNWYHLP